MKGEQGCSDCAMVNRRPFFWKGSSRACSQRYNFDLPLVLLLLAIVCVVGNLDRDQETRQQGSNRKVRTENSIGEGMIRLERHVSSGSPNLHRYNIKFLEADESHNLDLSHKLYKSGGAAAKGGGGAAAKGGGKAGKDGKGGGPPKPLECPVVDGRKCGGFGDCDEA